MIEFINKILEHSCTFQYDNKPTIYVINFLGIWEIFFKDCNQAEDFLENKEITLPSKQSNHSEATKKIYSKLDFEFGMIFKKIGIKYQKENFNHRFRKTSREKDYRKYYKDDETIEAVSKHFRKDLETFGDKF